MNEHWTRWIHASLAKYFKQYAQDKKISLFVEAESKAPDKLQDKVELRWDGPDSVQLTKHSWKLVVTVNMLVTSTTNRSDAYAHKKLVGLVQTAMAGDISIFKLGMITDIDTAQLLSCLQLKDQNGIVTSYFGEGGVDIKVEQSTVEATYEVILTTR